MNVGGIDIEVNKEHEEITFVNVSGVSNRASLAVYRRLTCASMPVERSIARG